jgi:hypothetical protein
MSKSKFATAFDRHTHTDSSGYVHTVISINYCYVEKLTDLLEGTVDNKAGYGDAESAVAIGVELQGLLDEGYKTRLTTSMSGLNIRLSYLHYNDGYCEPNVSVGENFGVMENGMKFLKRLGRFMGRNTTRDVFHGTFRSHFAVFEALQAMRGTVETDIVGRSHFRVAQRKFPKAA